MGQVRKLRPRGEVTARGAELALVSVFVEPQSSPCHPAPGLRLGSRNRPLGFLFSQNTQTNGGAETGQQTLGIQEADTQESVAGGERGGGLSREGGMWT